MHYYFIGIKGVGMTALAQVFKSQGHDVSGSDTDEKFFTDEILQSLKIPFYEEFDEEHITKNIDYVIRSSAYSENNNAEVKKVIDQKIKMMEYPEALGEISKTHFSVSVCGTHGKTSTTAILGVLAKTLWLDPLCIVGSSVPGFNNKNARTQSVPNDLFIAETCEYKRNFLYFYPDTILLPSLDFDHADYYKDQQDYENAFHELINKLPKDSTVITCMDDIPHNFLDQLKLNKNINIITYGFNNNSDVVVSRPVIENGIQTSRISNLDIELSLQIPGEHNILNAVGALLMIKLLTERKNEVLDYNKARQTLLNFQNTKRRFEKTGEYNGAIIIDDYAHHPKEISATLYSAKSFYKDKNIIVVFQSHTFSRTQKLEQDFAKCFYNADKVIIAPIYPSAREKKTTYTSQDFYKTIQKYHNNVLYFDSYDKITDYLKKSVTNNDIVITMGAGDIWKTTAEL